jgi:glycosyltransferase involved in cell wall biosynthesis
MTEHLVSILIPYKNTAPYLKECLESILKQTYTNWEVLAINDHSTDESQALVQGFAAVDPRIKMCENNGKGIIAALRLAFAMSKGAYVTRMDSDDIMLPNKLEVMVKALKQHGEGHIAVGQVSYFSHRGISNGYERYEKWLNRLTAKGTNYSEIYKECVIPSPCWMVYRKDLEKVGAFMPNRYPEDYDLTFRCYAAALTCIPCTEVLHLWRDYDTRTSRTSEHYAQNYFLDIKLYYFLALDWDEKRPLVVWGAGAKGKSIAKALLERKIAFYWVCDNPKKIGKKIYGQEMLSFENISQTKRAQSIITVANDLAQKEINQYFNRLNQRHMVDYFFFC